MSSPATPACQAWVDRLAAAPVPVLHATRRAIAGWRERIDDADAHTLAEIALADPLMCVTVLANAGRRLAGRLATPVETVTGALVLTGVESFFRECEALPELEERLAAHPRALTAAMALVQRSHSAARLAAAFAIHRQDEDVELLHQAALLHECAGLMLWAEAPVLSLSMLHRQLADHTLRTADIQLEVLGTTLEPVGRGLMQRWGLPSGLCELVHPTQQHPHPGARTVELAVRIARHLDTPYNWHNPALPDDFEDLGQLLNLPATTALTFVRRVWP